MCLKISIRKMVLDFGIWDELRIDHGTEWALMPFMQNQLAQFRNDTPYVQSSSKLVGRNIYYIN